MVDSSQTSATNSSGQGSHGRSSQGQSLAESLASPERPRPCHLRQQVWHPGTCPCLLPALLFPRANS
eukprot:scaffold4987_cov363-Prasinococcus_capsulatus_cf.AAC.6